MLGGCSDQDQVKLMKSFGAWGCGRKESEQNHGSFGKEEGSAQTWLLGRQSAVFLSISNSLFSCL